MAAPALFGFKETQIVSLLSLNPPPERKHNQAGERSVCVPLCERCYCIIQYNKGLQPGYLVVLSCWKHIFFIHFIPIQRL